MADFDDLAHGKRSLDITDNTCGAEVLLLKLYAGPFGAAYDFFFFFS